jgi:hypothetical protein
MEYPGAVYHPPSFNFSATSLMNRGDRRAQYAVEPAI